MVLIQETIDKYGYDPREISKWAKKKKVVCVCDKSGIIFDKNIRGTPIFKTNKKRKREVQYEDRVWARKIYEASNFSCANCFRAKLLKAHHIYSFNKHESLRLNTNNGICLCQKCHNDFHITYGKFDNNINQLIEFFPNLYNWLEKLRELLYLTFDPQI